MPRNKEAVERVEKAHAELRAEWARIPVTDLLNHVWREAPAKNPLVRVDATASCEQAFATLISGNVTAAPIFDAAKREYTGLVSMHDVVAYIVTLLEADPAALDHLHPRVRTARLMVSSNNTCANEKQQNSVSTHASPLSSEVCLNEEPGTNSGSETQSPPRCFDATGESDAIMEIAARARLGKAISVSMISDLSQRDPLVVLPKTATALDAMDYLARGITRVLVSDPDELNQENAGIIGIVSQGDVIRYLTQNHENLPAINNILSQKLGDLGLCEERELVMIKSAQSVLEALKLLQQNRVSSIAVIDPSNLLIGNISVTDAKMIMRSLRSGTLFLTCAHFISVVKTRRMLNNAGKDTIPVIQASPSSTLSHCIRQLRVTGVHRLWVTNQDLDSPNYLSPTGVVSMTDILRVLL